MDDSVTPSQLRADIYRLIDRVLETGEPLEIERRGRRLRLVAEQSGSRVARIESLDDLVVGDPDDLVSTHFADEWDADRALEP